MARAAFLLLVAARIGGDARMPPCPAGVKDDLNWYTTTSGGKVHDCAWLRLDPDTRCNNDGRFLVPRLLAPGRQGQDAAGRDAGPEVRAQGPSCC